jgi:hypothetical protein
MMKTMKPLLLAVSLSAVMIGCGQKEPPAAAPSATPPTASTSGPGPGAVEAVKQTVESAQQVVQKTVDEASAKAQALIDQAKTMVSEKKYSDALGALGTLANSKLSPEQQTLVQGLKVEVAKLGGDIEKGITNLKTVVAQKDYTQGMNLVNQLTNYQLTPDQQKVVDGLKAEVQKALGGKATGDATKALGNVLGGNK